jgi:hypothetical protein
MLESGLKVFVDAHLFDLSLDEFINPDAAGSILPQPVGSDSKGVSKDFGGFSLIEGAKPRPRSDEDGMALVQMDQMGA